MSQYIKFSERMGQSKPRNMLGKFEMPEHLMIRTWIVMIQYPLKDTDKVELRKKREAVCDKIWDKFFKLPLNIFAYSLKYKRKMISEKYISLNGIEIYDFIEFVVYCSKGLSFGPTTEKEFNILFEEELVPYRFINSQLVPITNKEELAEIEKVNINSNKLGLTGVSKHMKQALTHYSNRENPDYRNCIKECISAIEAICRVIVDDKSAPLGKALSKLKKNTNFNEALIRGFEKIYGFTNGDSGIRHALDSEDGVREEDARYFLISSSAFINYLIVKANNQGLIVDNNEL